VYSKEATQDMTMVLGSRKERLYRLLGIPIIGSSGYLDSVLDSISYSNSLSETLLEIGSYNTPSSINGIMSP